MFEIQIKNETLLNSLNNFIDKYPNEYYSLFMYEELSQTTFIMTTNRHYAVEKPQYYLLLENKMIYVFLNSNVSDFFVLNGNIDLEIKKRGYNIQYEQENTINLYTPHTKQLIICKCDSNLFIEKTKFIPLKPEDICK